MPVSRQVLKNAASHIGVYFRGMEYTQQGRVRILDEEVSGSGTHVLNALVRGSLSSPYQVFLELSGTGDEVLQATCTCPAFSKYEGYCKHIVATVLAVEEETSVPAPFSPKAALRKTKPYAAAAPITDAAVLELMRYYARRSAFQAASSDLFVQAELLPRLELGDFPPRLSFHLQAGRLYAVRDVEKLQQALAEGSELSYGKGLTLSHRYSSFREDCHPLLRFIQAQPRTQYSYYGEPDFKRFLCLSPHGADEFFSLIQNKPLTVLIAGEERECSIREALPELSLQLARMKNETIRLSLRKRIEIISGLDALYLVRENVIYRCPSDFQEACERLLTALRKNQWTLSLRETDLHAFYSCVLQDVAPFLHLETKLDLSAYEPLPMTAAVYLDLPAPGTVSAQLRFRYGDRDYDGFRARDLLTSRDIRRETLLEETLKRYFPPPDPETGMLFLREDEEGLYRLISHGIEELSALAELFVTDSLRGVRVQSRSSVQLGVRVDSGLLELDFSLEGVDTTELLEVLRSYRQSKKYHRLRNGSFLNLEDPAVTELSELSEGLNLDAHDLQKGHAAVPEYRALYLDSLMKESDRLQYDRDSSFMRLVQEIKEVSDSDFQVPSEMEGVLRHYQQTGYRWLRTVAAHSFGGILADDMGLGKTIQVLTLLLASKQEREQAGEEAQGSGISLVACPSSLVLNWVEEVAKFAPSLKTVAVLGLASRREELLAGARDADLIVTSYDLLKRDVELYQGFSFDYQIIDEAQYIKNPTTQNAKAVKTVHSRVRFALTGTPVENSLADLWSIYDYLMPGYLYSYGKFRRTLELPIVREQNPGASERLRRLVSPFILRRLKRDVLKELPEKVETVLYAEMTEEQRKLYLANALDAAEKLSSEEQLQQGGAAEGGRMIVLSLLMRLRQICCDPSLLYEEYTGGSGKLELCLELVQSCMDSGHKLLLFSQFTSMLAILEKELDARDISYRIITGDTPTARRLELVNAFNRDDTPVFLISLKAGGTGLNLTGADVVIHYDPWWNLSAQNQATDRVHRIGQENSVQVYRLIARDSIEEKILKMQESKARLSEDIIKEGAGVLSSLTPEEILDLFR